MQKGFQLVELAMAMAILGVVSAVGLSGIAGLIGNHRLHSAGQILMGTATMARAMAITRNTRIQLQPNNTRDRVAAQAIGTIPAWRPLPRDVRVESVPVAPITFHSRGIAAPAGTWVLENEWGRLRVVVSPSGRVRWERE